MKSGLEIETMNALDDSVLKEPDGGLLWTFRLNGLNLPTVLEALRSGLEIATSQDWYWFHFASAHEPARHLIRALPNLPEDAKDSLIDQDGGLRLDVEGDTDYGAIADFERDLSGRTKETVKLAFALNGRMFISKRRHALYSTDRVRQQFERGHVPTSPIDLLEMILSHFAYATARELSELSHTLDDIEDRVLQPEVNDNRIRLAPIRRMSAWLHRDMFAIRNSFSRFEKLQLPLPTDFNDAAIRLARELEALDHDAVLLQDRTRLL